MSPPRHARDVLHRSVMPRQGNALPAMLAGRVNMRMLTERRLSKTTGVGGPQTPSAKSANVRGRLLTETNVGRLAGTGKEITLSPAQFVLEYAEL